MGTRSRFGQAAAGATGACLAIGWAFLCPALAASSAPLWLRAVSLGLALFPTWRAAHGQITGARGAIDVARRVLYSALAAAVLLSAGAALASAVDNRLAFTLGALGLALAAPVIAGATVLAEGDDEAPFTVPLARLAVPGALLLGGAGLLLSGAAALGAEIPLGAGSILVGAAALAPCGIGALLAVRLAADPLLAAPGDGPLKASLGSVDSAAAEIAPEQAPADPGAPGGDDEIERLQAAFAALRRRLEGEVAAQTESPPPPLSAADQLREDFLIIVGEELRAPLEEIGALSSSMIASRRLTPPQAEDVTLILSGSGELLGLVEMVLSPPELDGPVLRMGAFDLAEVVRDVVRAQRPIAEEKKLGLSVVVEGAGATDSPERSDGAAATPAVAAMIIRGDPRRMRQVVTNLVSNAVKFTPDGHIRVTLRRAGGGVEMQVHDDGVGIAPTDLPRIFGAYEQSGSGLSQARGTGLGLSICKQIVEAHGGTIEAESAVGRGSTFRVRLPAAEARITGLSPMIDAAAPPPVQDLR